MCVGRAGDDGGRGGRTVGRAWPFVAHGHHLIRRGGLLGPLALAALGAVGSVVRGWGRAVCRRGPCAGARLKRRASQQGRACCQGCCTGSTVVSTTTAMMHAGSPTCPLMWCSAASRRMATSMSPWFGPPSSSRMIISSSSPCGSRMPLRSRPVTVCAVSRATILTLHWRPARKPTPSARTVQVRCGGAPMAGWTPASVDAIEVCRVVHNLPTLRCEACESVSQSNRIHAATCPCRRGDDDGGTGCPRPGRGRGGYGGGGGRGWCPVEVL